MAFRLESSDSCNRSRFFDWQSNENYTYRLSHESNFGDLIKNIFKSSDEVDVNHARTAVILASLSYLILLYFNAVFHGGTNSTQHSSPKSFLKEWILNNCDCSKKSFVIVCLITFVLTLPLVILLLLLAFVYREIVHFDIKRKFGIHFMSFLEGTDALWALEDDISLSVINIMALIKVTPEMQAQENSPTEILYSLRRGIQERLLRDFKQFPKLFYKRCKEHGFAFWTDENEFNIEQYIRSVPSLGAIDDVKDNREYIEKAFSELSNRHLLYNHTASWEILVAERLLEDRVGDSTTFYNPVLIRMHHSLGDGVSLLRFFLEIIADKDTKFYETQHNVGKSNRVNSQNPVLAKNSINQRFTSIKARLRMILKSPAALIYQAAFHQIDRNSLHPPKLSGNKVVCWRFENHDDRNLMESIRTIKRHSTGARFSDVILTALSLTIEEHIDAMDCSIPDDMTVVNITRFAAEGPILKLQNRFTVGLQKIPIRSHNLTRTDRFYTQLARVNEYSEQLRNSPDFFVNYWVISFLTCLLPDFVLGSLIESVHSTIEFSNLPGPETTTKINGHEIANITFWVPHRGSTGIGLSILSYGQKLQFGLIADCAVLPNLEIAQQILERMVDEIKYIHDCIRK